VNTRNVLDVLWYKMQPVVAQLIKIVNRAPITEKILVAQNKVSIVLT